MNEIWKDVPGYEGYYQCSNLGRVKSLDRVSSNFRKLNGKLLKPVLTDKGYLTNTLCDPNKKGKNKRIMKVHRIVAITFLENLENSKEINHIDGNKQNNTVENLEWVTRKQNMIHASKKGLVGNKLTEKTVMEIRSLCDSRLGHKPTLEQIAKLYKIGEHAVRKARLIDVWKH